MSKEPGALHEKHRLFERERKWQPLEVVIAQFRQAITVDIERGGILVRYAGPHRNNMLAGDLLDLVLKQLVPKDRRGLRFHMRFGEEEAVRPYPIVLPLLGAMLGMAGALTSTRLQRKIR